MLKIRLQRTGRKANPVYRVVVTPHTSGPKSGKYVESLGWYDAKQGTKDLNSERITYWISQGAQVSGTVHNFLVDEKIVSGKKVNVSPKRKPKKDGEGATDEKAATEAKTTESEAPKEEEKKEVEETKEVPEEPKEEMKEEEKPQPKEEKKEEEVK